MSCPKCDGLVTFGFKPLAFERGEVDDEDGFWVYWDAYCEDCDWKGIGRQWCPLSLDILDDDVELPDPSNKNVV